jgi:pSer/pThr/pTyr-binding forkhead associated (FHA) protein
LTKSEKAFSTKIFTREIPSDLFRPFPSDALFKQRIRAIELHVPGHPAIVVNRTEVAILGRRSPNGQVPTVDLTDYQAYLMGVSRCHATFEVNDSSCTIRDLGSANGTWLNGEKLDSHVPHPLKDGDEIRLGKLNMVVQIQVEMESTALATS